MNNRRAVTPTLEEARAFSMYDILPISTEIKSDGNTPIEVMRTLKSNSSHCFILESVDNCGRYTFLGFEPKMKITARNGKVILTKPLDNAKSGTEPQNNEPNSHIQSILDSNKAPKIDGLPPFCGGLVGYFAYDYAKYFEPSLNFKDVDNCPFCEVDLMLFDKVIAFDHHCGKIILIVNIGANAENLNAEYERGKAELEKLARLIKTTTAPTEFSQSQLKSDFTPLFTKEEYCNMVNRAKEYIKEGDIFQVVLSNRFEADFEGSLFDTY
ncbi:MAG: chorismate-binding protein, partial [Oscillospiraceae bacterium]|nr:chorismate-binding protein [Oscillospiraceae bacterium]